MACLPASVLGTMGAFGGRVLLRVIVCGVRDRERRDGRGYFMVRGREGSGRFLVISRPGYVRGSWPVKSFLVYKGREQCEMLQEFILEF